MEEMGLKESFIRGSALGVFMGYKGESSRDWPGRDTNEALSSGCFDWLLTMVIR